MRSTASDVSFPIRKLAKWFCANTSVKSNLGETLQIHVICVGSIRYTSHNKCALDVLKLGPKIIFYIADDIFAYYGWFGRQSSRMFLQTTVLHQGEHAAA